jgi:hypothetical protein
MEKDSKETNTQSFQLKEDPKILEPDNKQKIATELASVIGAPLISEDGPPMIVPRSLAHQWLIDNTFIKEGYRINYKSFGDLTASIFTLHNETANIWTHLIAFLVFIVFIGYTLVNFDPEYYEFLKYRFDLRKVDWEQFSSATLYDSAHKLIHDLAVDSDYQLYKSLGRLWAEFSTVFGDTSAKSVPLKFHTLARHLPGYFPGMSQVDLDKNDTLLFSRFFDLVSSRVTLRPTFRKQGSCTPKSPSSCLSSGHSPASS